jgi:hypothetical protein
MIKAAIDIIYIFFGIHMIIHGKIIFLINFKHNYIMFVNSVEKNFCTKFF